jgi:hypothetical protein
VLAIEAQLGEGALKRCGRADALALEVWLDQWRTAGPTR